MKRVSEEPQPSSTTTPTEWVDCSNNDVETDPLKFSNHENNLDNHLSGRAQNEIVI